MPEIDVYLDELVSLLDCDPLRRDEIRLEVHSHLRELMQGELRRGSSPAEAARAAIARLGTAEVVARGLRVARRRRVPMPGRVTAGRWAIAVASVLAMPVVAIGAVLATLMAVGPKYHRWSSADTIAWAAAQLLCALVVAVVVWAISRNVWIAVRVGFLIWLLQLPSLAPVVPPALACGVVLVGVVVAGLWLSRHKTRSDTPGQGLPAESREARPTYELDAYLGELVSRLDCDPLRRDEIRLEVHSHLRELLEKEKREGKSPTEAAQEAIARFGTADEVARRLAPVNRGRVPTPLRASPGWRVLAVVAGLFASWVAVIPSSAFYVPKLMAYVALMGRPHGATEAVMVAYIAMYSPLGPTAALVAWAVSRRPWDSLFACPLLLLMLPGGNHFWSWATDSTGRAQVATALVGAILAAYLLSKRERRLGLTSSNVGADGEARFPSPSIRA